MHSRESGEYIYIPLDIFLDIYHKNNLNITEELDAWMLFLASDNPADIARLIDAYPRFRELYAEIAAFQQKPEELVNMYSKALEIMDLKILPVHSRDFNRELTGQVCSGKYMCLSTLLLKIHCQFPDCNIVNHLK